MNVTVNGDNFAVNSDQQFYIIYRLHETDFKAQVTPVYEGLKPMWYRVIFENGDTQFIGMNENGSWEFADENKSSPDDEKLSYEIGNQIENYYNAQ